jgi:hypothetical protein
MSYAITLISVSTRSFEHNDGSLHDQTFAMLSINGNAPGNYRVYPHENCAGEGYTVLLQEAWYDEVRCTGCDYEASRYIGD